MLTVYYDILRFPALSEFNEAVKVAIEKDLRVTEEVFTVKVKGPYETIGELFDAKKYNSGKIQQLNLQMYLIEPRSVNPRPNEEEKYILQFFEQDSNRRVYCSYDFKYEHGMLQYFSEE